MTERMGANGMPIKTKVLDEIVKDDSKQMIQEILQENPNVSDDIEEEICAWCEQHPCVCDDKGEE